MFTDIVPPEKPISWTSRYNGFVNGVADRTLGAFRRLQLDEKDSTTLKTIKIACVALAGIAIVALLCLAIVKGSRMLRSPEKIDPAGTVLEKATETFQSAKDTVVEKVSAVVTNVTATLTPPPAPPGGMRRAGRY